MRSICFIITLCVLVATSFAQKQIYEFTSYTPPKGWTKEVKANTYTSYSIINNQKKIYCQLFIMLSTDSKGSIKDDFKSEWENLVAKQYGITDTAQLTPAATLNGWQVLGGVGFFKSNGTSTAMLTTMSGYNKAVSIIALTNSEDYIPAIQQFLTSVEMKKPVPAIGVTKPTIIQTGKPNFTFTSTNYEDGWEATAQTDWVQLKKGNTKALIHYPNKQADAYNSVLLDGLKNAWDLLVSPRYSNAVNMDFKASGGWEPIEFAEADMIEIATGTKVYVALFKKNYNNGSGKYVEFISPSKQLFEQEFGAYQQNMTGAGFTKMENMAFLNKFAVAASDLFGKWTSDFSGAIQYVNAYTGFDAGMDTHAAAENYQFGAGNTYKWDLAVASGRVGNIKFQNVQSNGKYTMDGNWKVNLSDIEGKPRSYDVYFSCIKGLRVLWINNKPFARAE